MTSRNNKKDASYIEQVIASQSLTDSEKELCDIAKYYIEQSEERREIGHKIFLAWVEDKRLAENTNELYRCLQQARLEIERSQQEIKWLKQSMQEVGQNILSNFDDPTCFSNADANPTSS